MLPIKTLILSLCLAFSSAAGVMAQTEDSAPEECSMMKTLNKNAEASWYGPRFHGRKTASGERFDMNDMTAAHKTLKLGTLVRVYNLKNGMNAVVRVNDRGPYIKGRTLDVSKGAAEALGFRDDGIANIRLNICLPPDHMSVT